MLNYVLQNMCTFFNNTEQYRKYIEIVTGILTTWDQTAPLWSISSANSADGKRVKHVKSHMFLCVCNTVSSLIFKLACQEIY